MTCKNTILIGLLCFVSPALNAMTVTGLYETTVTVKDKSNASYNAALRVALIQVLVKLTGDKNIARRDFSRALTSKAGQLVQQFRYQTETEQDQQTGQSNKLWVAFDQNALNRLLQDYRLSLWGQERPSILIWLAHQQQGVREIVNFEQMPSYFSALDARAKSRGVPLLLPLLDLEDKAQIKVSDVWAGFKGSVAQASLRYQANIILTGKLIKRSEAAWEISWLAYDGGEEFSWSHKGNTAEIVLQAGIDHLVNRLAERYASTNLASTEVIKINITDIHNLDRYAKALAYLESLQSASAVQVRHVGANQVLFELNSHTPISAIEQAIKLGNKLEFISHTEQLNYRLLP